VWPGAATIPMIMGTIGFQHEIIRGKEMTEVYFIRHAESDTSVRDGRIRPLTEKGLSSRILVTKFLQDKNINVVFSSPYKRAVDTISDFAEKNGFEIEIVEDFREQKSSSDMRRDNPDFRSFLEQQWADFTDTFSDGEYRHRHTRYGFISDYQPLRLYLRFQEFC
jgi:broad specificity phosphatase PhoE